MGLEWIALAFALAAGLISFIALVDSLTLLRRKNVNEQPDHRQPRRRQRAHEQILLPPVRPIHAPASYDDANLIQAAVDGKMIWNPTPVVAIDGTSPITTQHVALMLNFSDKATKGEKVKISADISNNHTAMQISDLTLLEILLPTGASELLGPDSITLGPNGDTVSLSYLYQLPFIKGTYTLRLQLLNLHAETSKHLVVA